MKWQPIETAPKDGSEVLFFWPSGGIPIGKNHGIRKMPKYYDASEPWKIPTHWMPLPAGPEAI